MAKWVCSVCGYVHEGDTPPEKCPVCNAPASKFNKQDEGMTWAAEHVVGVAQGVSEDILEDLRANFNGECSEVGMYLAWQELLTEKAIRKLVFTMKKLLTKKLNMLLNLLNFSVKLLLTAQRKTLRCV